MKKYPQNKNYLVTEDGKVFNKKTNKFVPLTTKEDGYITLSLDGSKRLHRVVAETYLPNPNHLPEVNHLDGVKANCHKDNLEWCTSKQNKEHAWRLGLYKDIREDHCNAVHSDKQIHEVCRMLQEGYRNIEVASTLNIHKDIIAHVKRGDIWRTISQQYNIHTVRKKRKSINTVLQICTFLEQGKSNKEVSSLLGITPSEVDKVRTGVTHKSISSNFNIPKSKMSRVNEDQVKQVCELIISGKKNKYIAEVVGISVSIVSKIKRGKTWTHLTEEYNW